MFPIQHVVPSIGIVDIVWWVWLSASRLTVQQHWARTAPFGIDTMQRTRPVPLSIASFWPTQPCLTGTPALRPQRSHATALHHQTRARLLTAKYTVRKQRKK